MFQVPFYNENMILGYVSGRIRHSFIRILPGDKIKMEVSHFDSSGGRIIYRPRNKNSNDYTVFQLQHSFFYGDTIRS